jgi:glutamyl-tRNA synthetase
MSTSLSGPVRVRFAPSPTGYLHVGGARTAIYNDLLRHRLGGANILRIEDTDRERSDEAMTAQIVRELAWLGVVYDEGPFLQSARLPRHRERAEELAAAGRAYHCFCTPETLDAGRAEAIARGTTYRYPRTCHGLAAEEVARRHAAGEKSVIRFLRQEEPIVLEDLVRGRVDFAADAADDFILLRSDGSPTYHLSVVCDDIDMGVTVVIRGEDHLVNTAKHIPLFRALGAAVPTFGHLPLILGPDKKRLSKRTGATSVEEYRALGILPQALYNFLTLLGWNPGDEREIMSRDELAAAFTTERIQPSAAVFDPEKLLWMNGQYLNRLSLHELRPHLAPFLASEGMDGVDPGRLDAAVELHRPRARTLVELASQVRVYFVESFPYDPSASKFRAVAGLGDRLATLGRRFAAADAYTKEALEQALRALAEELGIKAADLIHPLRMALTGQKAGPPLFDVLELLGPNESARRLAAFLDWLSAAPPADGGSPVA